MAQTQTLSLAQRQQLQMVLAPQLRQSLEMLQLPVLELRALIQQEIEQNPTIEEKLLDSEKVELEPGSGQTEESKELDFDTEYEALAQLDDEWRDYFLQQADNMPYTPEAAEKRQFVLDSLPQRESLQEHLMRQLRLAELSETDVQIGTLIIGNINDDGYLVASVEDLASSANYDPAHVADVLSTIQDFHPPGIGARDLRECLLIQLERLDKADTTAAAVVNEHLDKLAARKIPDIARALKVTIEEVKDATQLIGTLDPKPGRAYSSEEAAYIHPEIVVQKVNGEYVIVLDDDRLPHVRISKQYRALLSDPATSNETKSYIRERIRAGAFLIKSIHQRQRTIYRIASEIVARQKDFLDNGIAQLKPLTMAEVAAAAGVHETTVSRAVSGKYMRTPGGVFELKYFFTPGIKTRDGTEVSNKTVKDMIAGIVAAEDPTRPLADQDIAAILKDKGIHIARRTIAKYRLVLRIPPSHLRRGY
ncbi:MAG: RNA polymerase factor sigma-54 [Lentisphaerae bacterium]|nr:RNA polymerase factor sigma-54 [Lentisphaerota bacterium]